MAKKKKLKFKFNWQGLALIIVGAAMFALAFIPAIKSSYSFGPLNGELTNQNFYQIISSGFSENASTEMIIMAVASLINLIVAGFAIVFGILSMFGILGKKVNLIANVLYLKMIVATIAITICFFIFKNNLGNIPSQLKVVTYTYFLLGLALSGLAANVLIDKTK